MSSSTFQYSYAGVISHAKLGESIVHYIQLLTINPDLDASVYKKLLNGITKKELLLAIKTIAPLEMRVKVLKKSIQSNNPLGNRFWKQEGIDICTLSAGTLAILNRHLEIISAILALTQVKAMNPVQYSIQKAILDETMKQEIVDAILTFPIELQQSLFEKCLVNDNVLGIRFWRQEGLRQCSLSAGILKVIGNHLAKLKLASANFLSESKSDSNESQTVTEPFPQFVDAITIYSQAIKYTRVLDLTFYFQFEIVLQNKSFDEIFDAIQKLPFAMRISALQDGKNWIKNLIGDRLRQVAAFGVDRYDLYEIINQRIAAANLANEIDPTSDSLFFKILGRNRQDVFKVIISLPYPMQVNALEKCLQEFTELNRYFFVGMYKEDGFRVQVSDHLRALKFLHESKNETRSRLFDLTEARLKNNYRLKQFNNLTEHLDDELNEKLNENHMYNNKPI